jgi:hypothetical protein
MSAHASRCAVVPQNQNHSTASTSADIEGNGCQCTLSVEQADEQLEKAVRIANKYVCKRARVQCTTTMLQYVLQEREFK